MMMAAESAESNKNPRGEGDEASAMVGSRATEVKLTDLVGDKVQTPKPEHMSFAGGDGYRQGRSRR